MQQLVDFLRLKEAKILLVLDYDGTLTEIVNNPMEAILTDKRKKILDKLNSKEDITILINSGRPIQELKELTDNIDLDLLGNHGLFFSDKNENNTILTVEDQLLKEWDKKMVELKSFIQNQILPKYPKLWLQENIHGFVLHTRQMDKEIKNNFLLEFKNFLNEKYKGIPNSRGKEIIEIKPAHLVNKGKGIEWFLNKKYPVDGSKYKLITVGDDVTDEDMFKFTNKQKNGITIKIGDKKITNARSITSAKIIIKSVDEFYLFLSNLAEVK